jgi:hypothetical protein
VASALVRDTTPGSAASNAGAVGYITPQDLLKTIKR